MSDLLKKQTVVISGRELTLKITLGFWKRCGFTREGAGVIEDDPTACQKALELAIFYGNKDEFGWNSVSDMKKVFTDSDFESIDEDYSGKLSIAMIHYLPEKMRKAVIKRMEESEADLDKAIQDAIGDSKSEMEPSQESEDHPPKKK